MRRVKTKPIPFHQPDQCIGRPKIDIRSQMTFTKLMDRQLVISSELHSGGYDDADNLLEVEFRTGGVYQYFGVPRESYDALMAAESKGRFFNSVIKPRYPYARV